MTTQIDTAKAAAQVRAIYCDPASMDVIAQHGTVLSGRGIKHRHGTTYTVSQSAWDRIRATHTTAVDF